MPYAKFVPENNPADAIDVEVAAGEDEGDVLVVDGPRHFLQGTLNSPQGVDMRVVKEPLVVVVLNPVAVFKFEYFSLPTCIVHLLCRVQSYEVNLESSPAIPDVHGKAVTVVLDARGHGEEGETARVAVLVIGAAPIVVEAVHEDTAVVDLEI